MKKIKKGKPICMLYETYDEVKNHHPLLDVRPELFCQGTCIGVIVFRLSEESNDRWRCIFEEDGYEILEDYGITYKHPFPEEVPSPIAAKDKVPFSKIWNTRSRYIDISKDISDNKKRLSKAIDHKAEIERDIKGFQNAGKKLEEIKSKLLKYFESIGIELDDDNEEVEEVPHSKRIRKQVFKKTASGYEED